MNTPCVLPRNVSVHRFVDNASSAEQKCQTLLAKIGTTKAELFSEFRPALQLRGQLLWLALNEAEALAWETGFPHLVFPALAREKAEQIAGWEARQQQLLQPKALMGCAVAMNRRPIS